MNNKMITIIKNGIMRQYESVGEFHDGLTRVKKADGSYAYVDTTWDEIVLDEGIKKVCCEESKLVANYIGTVIIKDDTKRRYEYIGEFYEGLACVRNFDYKWGYIDHDGNEIIPCVYDMAEDFSEGLGLVLRNGRWMFLNRDGKVQIKCPQNYKKVSPFHSGRARVAKSAYCYGYIDRTGKEVIPCQLYKAEDFDRGFATVVMRKVLPSSIRRGNPHIGVPKTRIWEIDVDGNRYFPEEAVRLKKKSSSIKHSSDEKKQLDLQKNCIDYYSQITLLGRTITLIAKSKLELIQKKKEFIQNIKSLATCLEKEVGENPISDGYQKKYKRSNGAKTK